MCLRKSGYLFNSSDLQSLSVPPISCAPSLPVTYSSERILLLWCLLYDLYILTYLCGAFKIIVGFMCFIKLVNAYLFVPILCQKMDLGVWMMLEII